MSGFLSSFGFLVIIKVLLFFFSFDLRCIFISKVSNCCCSFVISFGLLSLLFCFVIVIFCLILFLLHNHGDSGGGIWEFHFRAKTRKILKIRCTVFNRCQLLGIFIESLFFMFFSCLWNVVNVKKQWPRCVL